MPPPPPRPKLLVLDNIWFVLTISKPFSQIWKTKVTPFESGSCTKITAINAWKLLLIEKVRVSDPHSSGANCDIYYIISAIIRDSIRLFLPGFFFFFGFIFLSSSFHLSHSYPKWCSALHDRKIPCCIFPHHGPRNVNLGVTLSIQVDAHCPRVCTGLHTPV